MDSQKINPLLRLVYSFSLTAFLVFNSVSGQATTLVIENLDGAGAGFNDTTSVIPVGGNTGTTLGEQRINAFNHALSLVQALLPPTSQTIRIGSRFQDLGDCNTDGIYITVILGGAAPNTVHENFAGAGGLSPLPDTWYPGPVANILADTDLCPAGSTCDVAPDPITGIPVHLEAAAVFNTQIDNGFLCDFLSGGLLGWYYGLDGNVPPSSYEIDFVTIAFHEIIHALGFLSLIDVETGQLLLNHSDVYSEHLESHSTGELLPNMFTDTERLTAITSGNLHWTSPNVVNRYGAHMPMYAPNPPEVGSSISHFDLGTNQVMEPAYVAPNHSAGLAQELFDDLYVQVGCSINEIAEASCSDLIDNDCDGLIDGDDLDCPQPCLPTQGVEFNCSDTLDNDCNGLIDGEDPNCQALCSDPGCTITELPETSCNDNIDNDCDSLVDLNDSDCSGCTATELPRESTCDDNVDNDCDNLIDLNDSDCILCTPTEIPETTCNDNVDNDCDNLVDLNDSDCTGCTVTEMPEVTCNDNIDNDCDGNVDTADSDCVAPSCQLAAIGESCTSNGDCCSTKCRGPSGGKTCR